MKEYLSSVEDVLKEQNSSPEGLTSAEAEKRLEKFGKNKLKEGKKVSLIKHCLKGAYVNSKVILCHSFSP